jgi:hypothetical protein
MLWCAEKHRPNVRYDERGVPQLAFRGCIELQAPMVVVAPASVKAPKAKKRSTNEPVPPDAERPALLLRSRPPVVLAGQSATLTAELVGREDEKLYCPGVRWRMPDDTEASEESDCVPWGTEGAEYRRRWTRRVRFGGAGAYTFEVMLEKSGKVLMRQTVVVEVMG